MCRVLVPITWEAVESLWRDVDSHTVRCALSRRCALTHVAHQKLRSNLNFEKIALGVSRFGQYYLNVYLHKEKVGAGLCQQVNMVSPMCR